MLYIDGVLAKHIWRIKQKEALHLDEYCIRETELFNTKQLN